MAAKFFPKLAACIAPLLWNFANAHAQERVQSQPQVFASLAKIAKPDWSSFFRDPLPSTFSSRSQNALILGSLYADCFLAIQAEDAQQSKNLSRDLLALAKPLGVHPGASKEPQSERLDRGKSLADCAERKDWEGLRKELEASLSALESTLKEHEDDDLAALVTLGSWLRTSQIVACVLSENYDPESEALLLEGIRFHLLNPPLLKPGRKGQEDLTFDRILSTLPNLEGLLTPEEGSTVINGCRILRSLSAILGMPPKRKSPAPTSCALE